MTFEQHVIETYGKSVHQIELEIAVAMYAAHNAPATIHPTLDAERALSAGRLFIETMKKAWGESF
jgi:hypothetical protein